MLACFAPFKFGRLFHAKRMATSWHSARRAHMVINVPEGLAGVMIVWHIH